MSNDDDIFKYLPDLTTALKESDEVAVAERRRKALESSREVTPTPPPAPAVVRPAKDVPASPWASGPAAAVPKGALPSSFAPVARGAAPAAVVAARPAVAAPAYGGA